MKCGDVRIVVEIKRNFSNSHRELNLAMPRTFIGCNVIQSFYSAAAF